MLGHGVELKSLDNNCDSDSNHPDGRNKSKFLKKVREKVEYQVKHNTMLQKQQSLFDEPMVRWISAL